MKKVGLLCLIIILASCDIEIKPKVKAFHIDELQNLPYRTTNNAVVEGFISEKPYVFTFGGLDSTKLYSGIHLRSYRFDVTANTWQRIADLPDTLGKVASAASRVNDTIYIIGGYHVFKDHSERSSNKVHRYDVMNNRFLQDGTPIPVPIDDQVQAVWRDSLIVVVTGWSDKANVPNVQIYDPKHNSWKVGTQLPDNHIYKSFGASGTIIGDTIYYYGGAAMGKHYPIQNKLRKGIINPQKPTQIEWSHELLDSTIVGYRMGATAIYGIPHWIGGSTITYNYNPIAYNGSGGVSPVNRDLYYEHNLLKQDFKNKLPMDLRGIAEINDSTKIVVGGIEENQKVSNKVYQLVWRY